MTTQEEKGSEQSGTEHILRGYSGRIFIAITLSWAGLQLGRGVIPPLLPAIMDSLAITPFLAGLALTVLTVTNAGLQFLGGRLADAWSRKTVVMCSLIVLLAGLIVLLGAVNYPLFLLGVALVGSASGLFFTPMRASLADVFVSRRGRAYGVNEGVGSAAVVLAAAVAAIVLWWSYWRIAFVPGLVLVIVSVVVVHRWHGGGYVIGRVSLEAQSTFRGLVRARPMVLLLASYGLVVFSIQGAFGFLPAMLQAEHGFSPSLASLGYAALFVTGAVGMPVAGVLSDRADRLLVAAIVTVLAGLGILGVTLAPSPVLIFGAIGIFAIGILGYPPVVQSHLMDVFPDERMAQDFGAFKTIYIAVGSLGPTYVGYTVEFWGYRPAFWGLGVCLFASSAIICGLWIRGRSDRER